MFMLIAIFAVILRPSVSQDKKLTQPITLYLKFRKPDIIITLLIFNLDEKCLWSFRANVPSGETYRGNSQRINYFHILRLGRP